MLDCISIILKLKQREGFRLFLHLIVFEEVRFIQDRSFHFLLSSWMPCISFSWLISLAQNPAINLGQWQEGVMLSCAHPQGEHGVLRLLR